MGLSLLAIASVAFGQGAAVIPAQGSALQVADGNLLLGLPDGGVALYDSDTGKQLLNVAGDGKAPTLDVRWLQGRPWWCDLGSPKVHVLEPDLHTTHSFDLHIGPIERLSQWNGYLLACSATGFRFIGLTTGQVKTPEQVLPEDIAKLARQGSVATCWADEKGIFLLVRRYGRHKPAKAGENPDVAFVNAWDSDYNPLGGHTCSLFGFQDAPGPDVSIQMGTDTHRSRFATTTLGNLSVTNEGFVGLGHGEIEAVPFAQKDWTEQHITVPVDPNYSQTLCQIDSTAWWTDGTRVYQASLEDGSTDVFVPKGEQMGHIICLRSAGDATWALTSGGIERVDPTSFAHYQLGGGQVNSGSGDQGAKFVSSMHDLASKGYTGKALVRKALVSAGVGDPVQLENMQEVGDRSLQTGDVIVDHNKVSVYVGGGLVQEGQANPRPLQLSRSSRIVRPLPDLSGTIKANEIQPVGLGQPCSALGNAKYVEITHDTPYDAPYLPIHQKLAEVMQTWVGTPYRWGGNTYEGVDCSGFVCAVFRSVGVDLPRYSQDIGQAKVGEVVTDQLRYGDVLVYSWPHKHCAIYVGNGQVMEAADAGVMKRPMTNHPFGIVRRFVAGEAPGGK